MTFKTKQIFLNSLAHGSECLHLRGCTYGPLIKKKKRKENILLVS